MKRRNRLGRSVVLTEALERRQLLAGLAFDLTPEGLGATELTEFGGKVVFVGQTPATGRELFVTDGTPGGTKLLADLRTGTSSSNPVRLEVTDDGLYFFAAGSAGTGIYRLASIDGTPEFKAATPDHLGANFQDVSHVGSTYIYADIASGKEILRANANTTINVTILSGTRAGADLSNFTPVGSTTYFLENAPGGQRLWKTDGTRDGTVQIISGLDSIISLSGANGVLFADAVRDGTRGFFRYIPDVGFERLSKGSNGVAVAGINAEVVYTIRDKAVGTVLKSTESAANLPGTSSGVLDAVNYDGVVFFTNGAGELWTSDGTAAGTSLRRTVAEPNQESVTIATAKFFYLVVNYTNRNSSDVFILTGQPIGFAKLGTFDSPTFAATSERLIVRAAGKTGEPALSAIAKSNAVTLDSQFSSGVDGNPVAAVNFRDETLYVLTRTPSANANNQPTLKLWSSDGYNSIDFITDFGPNYAVLDEANNPGFGTAGRPNRGNGVVQLMRLTRTRSDGRVFQELYQTNGTAEGTYLVLPPADDIRLLGVQGQFQYFAISVGSPNQKPFNQIWRTNGTFQGTTLITHIAPAQQGPINSVATVQIDGYNRNFFTLNGKLWTIMPGISDPIIDTGETLITDPNSPDPTDAEQFNVIDDDLYFLARKDGGQKAVYVYDGVELRIFSELPANLNRDRNIILSGRTAPAGSAAIAPSQVLIAGKRTDASGNWAVWVGPTNSTTIADTREFPTNAQDFFANVTEVNQVVRAGGITYFAGPASSSEGGEVRVWAGAVLQRASTTNGFKPFGSPTMFGAGAALFISGASNKSQFWRFSGTAGEQLEVSTSPVLDPRPFVTFQDRLFYAGSTAADGRELRFIQLANRVGGTVFHDDNLDGIRNDGERAVAGQTVFVDENGNGQLDALEKSAVTDENGNYLISGLLMAQNAVRFVRVISPNNEYKLTDRPGDLTTDPLRIVGQASASFFERNVPVRTTPTVFGYIWTDTNLNGNRSSDEGFLEGVRIFADYNNDGILDANEPSVLSAADGSFALYNLLVTANFDVYIRVEGYGRNDFTTGRQPFLRPIAPGTPTFLKIGVRPA